MSPYVRRLRAAVGHDMLLLPSVAVLARDHEGRLLLMRSSDSGQWQTVGGAIDLEETPQDAARREAFEEAGVEVQLGGIMAVLGGPQYRMTYPNGDETAYVTTVFEAAVVGGAMAADGKEASDVAWFAPDDLVDCDMNAFTRALLVDVGLLRSTPDG